MVSTSGAALGAPKSILRLERAALLIGAAFSFDPSALT
jgi:hypothetical protein